MDLNKNCYSLNNLNNKNSNIIKSNSLPRNYFKNTENNLKINFNKDKIINLKLKLEENEEEEEEKISNENKSKSRSSENILNTDDYGDTSEFLIPSSIGILERLIRTHPIWLLTNIKRTVTTYLLQGKDVGSFIVRGSSKPGTLALSVRLPENKPYIEHYLIENFGNRKLHLEGSEHFFSVIPMLICYYCQCCDELPVCLKLPDIVLSSNRQQLNSLSLLGENFWKTNINEYLSSNKKDLFKKSNGVYDDSKYLKSHLNNSCNSITSSSKSSFKSSGLDSEFDFSDEENCKSDKLLNSSKNFKNNENLKECSPKRPPRNTFNKFNISPPPIPPRNKKPFSKNYFKLSTVKTDKQDNKKEERISNMNLLINFDVFEEEERLINQLKEENDFFYLNEIDAQTQQHFNSSQINKKLFKKSDQNLLMKNDSNLIIDTNKTNVTKIDNINEKNLKFSETNEYTSDTSDNYDSRSVFSETTNVKSLYIKESEEENAEFKEKNSYLETCVNQKEILVNYEDIWKDDVKVINNCEVQTEPQYFLNYSKWEKYRNFLVYDYAQTNIMNNTNFNKLKLKDSEFSFYCEPLDSINDQFLSKKSANVSNPNLYCKNYLNKNDDYHSFENLIYKQNESLYVRNNFFQRYIVPKDEKLSDVCLQVGDGLIKEEVNLQINNLVQNNRCLNEEILTSSKRTEITINGGKDLAWKLDSSWEWQNSDDEETSIIKKSSKKKLTSNTISGKYKRFSYKYVNESSIESENDYVSDTNLINEENSFKRDTNFIHSTLDENKIENYDNLLNNNKLISKTNSYELKNKKIKVQQQEANTLGYWQQQNSSNKQNSDNVMKNNSNKKKDSTILNEGSLVMLENKVFCLNGDKEDEQPILEDEDEQEMVFEEVGLEDIYTTNDELDDDSRLNLIENPYFVKNINFITSTVGKNISEYIFKLFTDNDNVFSKSIRNFIQCTKDSNEPNPLIVMRNIRQFMNGIKNYLIRNGEKHFLDLVKQEKKKLKQDEFLNLEAIIEGTLHKLVIKPLKELIYKLFIKKEYKFGYESFLKLTENINFFRGKKLEEFGISHNCKLPNNYIMKKLENNFIKLQNSYSPLKKVEYLLSIASIINNKIKIDTSSNSNKPEVANTDFNQKIDEKDFIQIFIYFLIKFNFINMEIESEYIWSLLQPSLLNGKVIHYLTIFSSCVYVMKSNFLSIFSENDQLLNKMEINIHMLISLLSPLNEAKVMNYKLNFFTNNDLNNSLIGNFDDSLNSFTSIKNRKKKSISKLSSYQNKNLLPSCSLLMNTLNNNNHFSDNFRFNEFSSRLKLNSIFTICCLKIFLLDEFTGNIKQKIISIKPEMITREFCKLVSQNFFILNAQDYSLFILNENDFEYLIDDNEIPFLIKINSLKNGINVIFVYKRTDSQYIWPKFNAIDFC